MSKKLYQGNLKGLLFIVCFRIAHYVSQHKITKICLCPIWILYRLVFNWVLGIDISQYATIGRNFVLWHGIGTIVHPQAIIGDNVTMRHNTTIGNAKNDSGAPIIGNNVDIGCNVVIIGDITIGDNVTIGAGTIITTSIPSNVVVVGNPSKVLNKNTFEK